MKSYSLYLVSMMRLQSQARAQYWASRRTSHSGPRPRTSLLIRDNKPQAKNLSPKLSRGHLIRFPRTQNPPRASQCTWHKTQPTLRGPANSPPPDSSLGCFLLPGRHVHPHCSLTLLLCPEGQEPHGQHRQSQGYVPRSGVSALDRKKPSVSRRLTQ